MIVRVVSTRARQVCVVVVDVDERKDEETNRSWQQLDYVFHCWRVMYDTDDELQAEKTKKKEKVEKNLWLQKQTKIDRHLKLGLRARDIDVCSKIELWTYYFSLSFNSVQRSITISLKDIM